MGYFPQDFGQVNEGLILKLHEMIRVLHIVACPFIFILFDDPDWQGGVLKLMKNGLPMGFNLLSDLLQQLEGIKTLLF